MNGQRVDGSNGQGNIVEPEEQVAPFWVHQHVHHQEEEGNYEPNTSNPVLRTHQRQLTGQDG